jgi:hypothetical protein
MKENLKKLYPKSVIINTTWEEVRDLNLAFQGIAKGTEKSKINVGVFISKNLESTKTALDPIAKLIDKGYSEAKIKYDATLLTIQKEYEPTATKDANGNPMYGQNGMLVIANSDAVKEYADKIVALKTQYDEEVKEVEKLGEQKVDVTLYPLHEKYKDSISGVTTIQIGQNQFVTPKYNLLVGYKIIAE